MTIHEKYIDTLNTLEEEDTRADVVEALDAGQEALAFVANTWKALHSVGRVNGEEPDCRAMELSLDVMNNQLSAAVLFLAGLPVDIPGALRAGADAYETHAMDAEVAKTLADAYRRLATTVEGVKVVAGAKQDLMINTVVEDEGLQVK